MFRYALCFTVIGLWVSSTAVRAQGHAQTLLQTRQVQTELKMTSKQLAKLAQAAKNMDQIRADGHKLYFGRLNQAPPAGTKGIGFLQNVVTNDQVDEAKKKFAGFVEANEAAYVLPILTAGQQKRLQQIHWQLNGPISFSAEGETKLDSGFRKALGATEEHEAKILAILKEKGWESGKEEIMDFLPEAQRENFTKALGAPFRLKAKTPSARGREKPASR